MRLCINGELDLTFDESRLQLVGDGSRIHVHFEDVRQLVRALGLPKRAVLERLRSLAEAFSHTGVALDLHFRGKHFLTLGHRTKPGVLEKFTGLPNGEIRHPWLCAFFYLW